jgi:hypothetical protein
MSLQAIAAMLGRRSLDMTLGYKPSSPACASVLDCRQDGGPMSRSSRRSPADALDVDRRKLWTDKAWMAAAVLVGLTAGALFSFAVSYATLLVWTDAVGAFVALILSLLVGVPAILVWSSRWARMRAFAVGFSVFPIAVAVWLVWSILTIPDFLGNGID